MFVDVGLNSLYLPSTKLFFNRHRPKTFQNAMKMANQSSDLPFYYELADVHMEDSTSVSCNISNNVNSGRTSRTLIVAVIVDFCNFTHSESASRYLCNHASPFNFGNNPRR